MTKSDSQALNQEGEENILDTTPVSEQEASEDISEPEEEAEVTAEAESKEEEKETEGEPKKGYSQRIRELVKEKKEAEAEAKSLAERLAELTAVEPKAEYNQQNYPQAEPIVTPGEEIDADELNRRLADREHKILQRADALSQLRSKQAEAVNRINNEATEVVKLYPELDPDDDNFDEELSNSITEAVEGYVSKNPYDAKVRQYVDKLMKPYKRAVTKEVGKVTENLAKQVSETALRPTSIRQEEKKSEDMTPEELEEKLGIIQA